MLDRIRELLISDLVRAVQSKSDSREARLYLLKIGLVEIEEQMGMLAQLTGDSQFTEKVIVDVPNPFKGT